MGVGPGLRPGPADPRALSFPGVVAWAGDHEDAPRPRARPPRASRRGGGRGARRLSLTVHRRCGSLSRASSCRKGMGDCSKCRGQSPGSMSSGADLGCSSEYPTRALPRSTGGTSTQGASLQAWMDRTDVANTRSLSSVPPGTLHGPTVGRPFFPELIAGLGCSSEYPTRALPRSTGGTSSKELPCRHGWTEPMWETQGPRVVADTLLKASANWTRPPPGGVCTSMQNGRPGGQNGESWQNESHSRHGWTATGDGNGGPRTPKQCWMMLLGTVYGGSARGCQCGKAISLDRWTVVHGTLCWTVCRTNGRACSCRFPALGNSDRGEANRHTSGSRARSNAGRAIPVRTVICAATVAVAWSHRGGSPPSAWRHPTAPEIRGAPGVGPWRRKKNTSPGAAPAEGALR